jgi:peptide/nickel transport system substrate-binding protein
MKAAFRLIVGVLLLSALLAACAPAPSAPAPAEGTAAPAEEASADPGEPQRGGVLVVGRPADVVLWDPKYTNDNSSLWAQGQVFATLVQNSEDGLELRPWLAESWEINEDATEYTFYLHDNAEFCNGTPITAEDVKWSIDRAMEDDSAVSWQFPANPVVEVIDDHTLKITLDRPNVAFSNYVTLWGSHVLSKAYAEEVGIEALAENPMGSGPFCVERWDKGQLVVLKPNPGYWVEGQPYVDEVQMRVVGDDNARVLQIQTGEIDIALDIPASQFQAIQGVDGVEAHIDTLYGTAAVVLNQRTVPEFADVNVRKAMLMALDRQAMVDSILFGQGEVAKSPFYGPAILFWTGDFEVPYDLEGAKALMAESVAPDGFAVELLVPAGDSIASDVGVIMKDQLAQLNIDVTVTPVESGTWWEMWSGGTYQMLYKLGTNDVIDPAENIPFDFWSFEDGGSDAAFTGYYNAELVKLSMDAEAELDVEKRAQLYYELQRIAMDEVPQLWLFHPDNRWATRDTVENFAVFPTKLHRFWEVWKSGE